MSDEFPEPKEKLSDLLALARLLQLAVDKAVAEERERCAKIADNMQMVAADCWRSKLDAAVQHDTAMEIAEAIRTATQKEPPR